MSKIENLIRILSKKIDKISLPIQPTYKIYKGLIQQNDSNNPNIILFENTIGNIVWTRLNTGEYIGTLAGAFPQFKTSVSININAYLGSSFPIAIVSDRQDDNIVSIVTFLSNSTGTKQDGLLTVCPIEIRVYDNRF